MVINEELERVY